jgi:hypothetical protein
MKIFISYRRDDTIDVAGRVRDRLAQDFTAEDIYMDIDSIPIGVDFRHHIDAAVRQCDVLLAVIGPDWLTTTDAHGTRRIDDDNDFVRLELLAALNRDIPVVPVLVRDAPMPSPSDLPEALRGLAFRQAVLVRRDPDFHSDMLRLMAGIRAHQPKPPPPTPPPEPPVVAAPPPLLPPEKEEADEFAATAYASTPRARSKRTKRDALIIGGLLAAIAVTLILLLAGLGPDGGGTSPETTADTSSAVHQPEETVAPVTTRGDVADPSTAGPVNTPAPQGVTDFDCNQWYVQVGSRVTSDPTAPGKQDEPLRALLAASGRWTLMLVDSRVVGCGGLGVSRDRYYWFVGPLADESEAIATCGAIRQFELESRYDADLPHLSDDQLALVRHPQSDTTSACN